MVCVVASLPDPNEHSPNLDVVESYAYLQKKTIFPDCDSNTVC